jgi:hypothetical protein
MVRPAFVALVTVLVFDHFFLDGQYAAAAKAAGLALLRNFFG